MYIGRKLLILAVCTTFLFSCTKEEAVGDGMIEIFAETMGGGSKVMLDGVNSTWVDGDSIRINSDKVVVERINSHAYIRYAHPQSVNRAVYPASLASGTLSSDNVTLTFPDYYHYRTDGSGHQLLDLPMAARSEGDAALRFNHLTGALYVTVTNTANVTLTLQSVTVSSNRYKLNGTRSVDLNDLENFGSATSSVENERSVTLVFDNGYSLESSESVKVMIPIMPVGGNGDNLFTIKVKSFASGQTTSYLYSRSQPSGSDHTLARNQLGYAPADITASGSTPVLEYNSGVYLIHTPLDFKMMVDAIQNSWLANNAQYSITEDIDMSETPVTPITNSSFIGTIDGGGHTVSNLTINSIKQSGTCYCALFSNAGSGIMLTNLHLNGLILNAQDVGSSTLIIAGLISDIASGGTLTLSNCSVSISSVNISSATSTIYFGGLLGNVEAVTNFTNCHVSALSNINVNGGALYCGGLIGYHGSTKSTMTSSSWNGNLVLTSSSTIRAGGLIGFKSTQSFKSTDCEVSGSINAQANGVTNYLGALIGQYTSKNSADITNLTKSITLTLNNSSIVDNNFGN